MNIYKNIDKNSTIASVEFSPMVEGNFTFITLRNREDIRKTRDWLASDAIGQHIIAETKLGDELVLVSRGVKSEDTILNLLKDNGYKLQPFIEEKKISPWKLRGWASVIGQPLQLLSGAIAKGGVDPATIGFASLNMTANVTNIIFGAEKSTDQHRLEHIKENVINGNLSSKLLPNQSVIPVHDNRTDPRETALMSKKSTGQAAYDFMSKNSVKFGEIGLRYIGATMLAFPLTKAVDGKQSMAHWGKGLGELAKGQFKTGYNTLRNNDKWTRAAGLAYIAGKTLAFASTVPDPYNPKPDNFLDTTREKYVFKASSIIETVAAGLIAYDRFFQRTIKFPTKGLLSKITPKSLRGVETRDFLGGTGGLLFTAGLIIRILAPFGVKEVDLKEVYAHASDTLAKTPSEKLPQLLADCTASLQGHLKDQHLTYGQIYTAIMNDVYQYHHLAILEPIDKPIESVASSPPSAQQEQENDNSRPEKKFADTYQKKPPHNKTSPTSFTELASRPPEQPAQAI